MAKDITIIIWVYLVSSGLQLMAWPWLFHYNKKLVDHGFAAGRVLASLAAAFLIWVVAHLKIPFNNEVGLFLTLILFFILTWKKRRKEIKPAFASLRRIWAVVVAEELLFLTGLVVYSLVRGYQPDILGLEKFMDFGFVKSYLSSATLPAPDMWWAGEPINYYSFGHFWTSIMIRLWGVTPSIGYNLMLAFLLSSGLALAFSVVINLFSSQKTTRVQLFAGLIGSLLVIVGGNSHTLWSWLTKGTLTGYWYADATRFIYNTIHEFPSYSFVVSDLHGHVLSLPIVITFLLFFIGWARGEHFEVMLGWLLGILAMTNTWDFLIYGLLLLFFGALSLARDKRVIWHLLKSGVIIGLTAFFSAFFWFTNFQSISSGVAAVTTRSPIWQLLVLWTIHVSATLIAMALALLEKRTNLLVIAIGLTALALILIPEFIYVRDIYPNHPRANTMFKLTYQAFIMMSLLFGFLFGKAAEIKQKVLRISLGLILLAAAFSLLIFPTTSFPSYYNNFSNYRGLSGFYFLETRYPTDLAMIEYLDENKDGRNMVEAVGDSYTETDFLSAFSGVPTVVGWRVHEWLWRGGYDAVGKRDEEVRNFYEGSSLSEKRAFLEKYNIGWISLTEREREKYKGMKEESIRSLGTPIAFGASYLVKVD